jgi:hypothetical protein
MNQTYRQVVVVLVVCAVVLAGLSGCNTCRKDIKLHDVFSATLLGAGVGWVVGHQSNEDGEGAAIGAGLALTSTMLQYLDDQRKDECEEEEEESEPEQEPAKPVEEAALEQGLFLVPVTRTAESNGETVKGVQLVFCRKF